MNQLRRLLSTTLVVVLGGIGATVAAAAPPVAPHVVIAAIGDDGAFLEGYNLTQGGADVSVELVRGGVVIANAGPFTPPTPPTPGDPTAIEINHLGEPTCWGNRTPDIVYGDTIRITQNGVLEESLVRNLTVGEPELVNETTVRLRGVATETDGLMRLPIGELGGRVINPAFQGVFGGRPFINIPEVRIGPNVTATATIAFDDPGNAANPNWTATIAFTADVGAPAGSAQAAAQVAFAAEPEIGWAGGAGTEVAETGVVDATTGGPVAPCTAPSGAYAVVAASPNPVDVAATTLSITGTARIGTTQVQVSIDDANPATPPVVSGNATLATHGGGMLWTLDVPAAQIDTLDNGTLTITPVVTPTPAVAVLAGSVVKDRGPGVVVTSGPANGAPTSQTSVTFGFTTTHPATAIDCSLDGAAYAPCTSPYTSPVLADGPHALRIRATAGAQVGSPTMRTWTVDTVAPAATIVSGPAALTNNATATFDFAASEPGSTFRCSLNGAVSAPCGDPASFSGLSNAKHSLTVSAVDPAGNQGAAALARWEVDRKRPILTARIPGFRNLPTARTGVLAITARCNERCSLVLRARIVVPRASGRGSTTITIANRSVTSAANATSKLRLRLNAAQLRRVRQALGAGKNVRISLTVVATDRAGNATVALPGVTLRPSRS